MVRASLLVPALLFYCSSFAISESRIKTGIVTKKNPLVQHRWFRFERISKQDPDLQNSVYGFVEVAGNFHAVYKFFKNNPHLFENENFDRQKVICRRKGYCKRLLVYSRWGLGDIFHLIEEHQLYKNGKFPNLPQKTYFWFVQSQLDKKSRREIISYFFRYMESRFVFVRVSKKRTRVYFFLSIDAKGMRTRKEIEQEVRRILTQMCKFEGAR